MEERPIVEGNGECTVSDELVNPLNLKKLEKMASLMASSLTTDPALLRTTRVNKSHSFVEYREKTSQSEKSSSSEKKSSSDENILNRVRRDRSMIIRAEKLIDKDGKKTNIVSMVSFTSSINFLKTLITSFHFRTANVRQRNAFESTARFTISSAKPKRLFTSSRDFGTQR